MRVDVSFRITQEEAKTSVEELLLEVFRILINEKHLICTVCDFY